MSPVIATILMVAITVVLAAVLYVMVSLLIVGPQPPPVGIGVIVEPSPDGTNWTVTVTSVPGGKALTRTSLVLKGAGGDIALTSAPLSTYLTETAGVKYVQVSPGAANIAVGDVILVDSTTYPQGHRYELIDGSNILASGRLE